MRGQVLGYDPATGEGMISGDDGNRYMVAPGRLGAGVKSLMPGRAVDFMVENGQAVDVYPLRDAAFDQKNKWIAAILALSFGPLGVHKFYLGRRKAGLIMLIVCLGGFLLAGIPSIIISIIALIEGIIYLVKSDQRFYDDYVVGERAWF